MFPFDDVIMGTDIKSRIYWLKIGYKHVNCVAKNRQYMRYLAHILTLMSTPIPRPMTKWTCDQPICPQSVQVDNLILG